MTLDPAVATLAGAMVGGGIAFGSTWYTQKATRNRWYSDQFLQKKINLLSDLYADLEACHFAFSSWGGDISMTQDGYDNELRPALNTYLRSYRLAKVYLNDDQQDPFNDLLGRFRETELNYINDIPDADWEGTKPTPTRPQSSVGCDLHTAYEAAKNVLEDELHPETLRDIED